MISRDVEDNLTFIAREELEWTTGSYFIQGSISLFEMFECAFRNVGDMSDFRYDVGHLQPALMLGFFA